MYKRTLLVIAVCVVAIVSTFLLIWNISRPQILMKYERNIARNLDNSEEENALAVAENINYSAIFSQERFDGSTDPEAYLHPGIYLEYTYANFIDSTAIDYYETRYNDLQGKGYPRQIEMTYEANVQKWTEIRVFNSAPPENVTWYNTTVVFSAPDGSVLFQNTGFFGKEYGFRFTYKNQSGYQTLEPVFDLTFSDCIIVEMKLLYSETYAPLAAFWSDVYQIVVLDQNFEPVLLGLEARKVIS